MERSHTFTARVFSARRRAVKMGEEGAEDDRLCGLGGTPPEFRLGGACVCERAEWPRSA